MTRLVIILVSNRHRKYGRKGRQHLPRKYKAKSYHIETQWNELPKDFGF